MLASKCVYSRCAVAGKPREINLNSKYIYIYIFETFLQPCVSVLGVLQWKVEKETPQLRTYVLISFSNSYAEVHVVVGKVKKHFQLRRDVLKHVCKLVFL